MATNTGHIMTLANSIIGVSVLAMPYCFKQCGIMMSILMLIISSYITRGACHFLVKSAVTCRRKSFEILAFHVFGSSGKLIVELCIIGFLMGTCIAFFVVMGDLGPVIVAKIFNIENNSALRTSVLFSLALFVVLPLGLLRNVESLTAISTATVTFYVLLILKLVFESTSSLASGEWKEAVVYWRPEGILQCIPIFSMGLACQTQVFEIFDTIPNATVDKMNSVVRHAVTICTFVYISVGLLGYIAYSTQAFTGNILLSFSPGPSSDFFKLCFILSLAVSFPVVIFPCRASLYSLIFKRAQGSYHELTTPIITHIPETRFKCLTCSIILVSLLTALMVPSIEFVLGFVGSTMGVAICVIFPSLLFINIFTKDNNERLFAKLLFTIGAVILVLGTYANLYADYEPHDVRIIIPKMDVPPPPTLVQIEQLVKQEDLVKTLDKLEPPKQAPPEPSRVVVSPNPVIVKVEESVDNQRKEPPIPMEPAEKSAKPSQQPAIEKVAEKVEKIEPLQPEMKSPEKIDKDAILKEEQELKEDEELKKKEDNKKENEFLKKLEEHKEEQKKLLEEQKEILKELKNKEDKKGSKDVDKIFYEVKKIDEEDKAIKPEKFNENIEKIQNVIDNLKDTNEVLQKEIKETKDVKVESTELKNKLPIPLALSKNLTLVEKDTREVAKVETKQEALGRDILDVKEIRAKREIDNTCDKKDNESVVGDKLVQNINHLSVQDPVINKDLLVDSVDPGVILPVVPRKRDLKSVHNDDVEQQESK